MVVNKDKQEKYMMWIEYEVSLPVFYRDFFVF